eukprot:jgi/Botrbrau1/20074/Bobra.200_1s0078.1
MGPDRRAKSRLGGLSLNKFSQSKQKKYDKRAVIEKERVRTLQKLKKLKKVKERLFKAGKLQPTYDLEKLQEELASEFQPRAADHEAGAGGYSQSHERRRHGNLERTSGSDDEEMSSDEGPDQPRLAVQGVLKSASRGPLDLDRIRARAGSPPSASEDWESEDDEPVASGSIQGHPTDRDEDGDFPDDGPEPSARFRAHQGPADNRKGRGRWAREKNESSPAGALAGGGGRSASGRYEAAQRGVGASQRYGPGSMEKDPRHRLGKRRGRHCADSELRSSEKGVQKGVGIEEDGTARAGQDLLTNGRVPRRPGGGKGKKKMKKPMSRLERLVAKSQAEQEARQREREERQRAVAEHQARVAQARAVRKQQALLFKKKTQRGQPVMKYRIESILNKLTPGNELFSH